MRNSEKTAVIESLHGLGTYSSASRTFAGIASVLRERNGNGCGQNENASSARSPRASSRMGGNASTDSPLGRRREHQPLPFASDGCTDNPESTGQRQLLIERKGSSEHPSRSPDPAAIRIESPSQWAAARLRLFRRRRPLNSCGDPSY